ncbi:MAG: hypothetical protein R3F54_14985 [Alphaproteobacteria bacterium]
MTRDEWTEAIIKINRHYVVAVAELCRGQPTMAGVYLNMPEGHVEAFARFTSDDLVRLNAIPIAITSPVLTAPQLLAARSVDDILRPVQAAFRAHGRGRT